jgi:hypothetical protein
MRSCFLWKKCSDDIVIKVESYKCIVSERHTMMKVKNYLVCLLVLIIGSF